MEIASKEDMTAACNLIKSHRESVRKAHARTYKKYMTIRLSKEHGRQLSTSLIVIYDPKNDSVTYNHCLKYFSHGIYPATNKHQWCINRAGMDALYNRRVLQHRIAIKNITTRLSIESGYQLSSTVSIVCNPKTDSVYTFSKLYFCYGFVYAGTGDRSL